MNLVHQQIGRGLPKWANLVKCSGSRGKASYTAAVTSSKFDLEEHKHAKEFADMPGYKGLAGYLDFAKKTANSKTFYRQFLPDYKKFNTHTLRTKFALYNAVVTCSDEEAAKIYRSSGKHPLRFPMDHFLEYQEQSNESKSLLTYEGVDWHRVRNAVNKRMMRPQLVVENEERINDVITDMIDRIRYIRDKHSGYITGMTNEAYKWSMESIASILFEERLGCLKEPVPTQSQQFINAVGAVFENAVFVIALPKLQRKLQTPYWKKFSAGFDYLYGFTRKTVNDKLEKLDSLPENRKDCSLMSFILANEQLSRKEAFSMISELFFAGVDTTSNTLCFALHFLAQNPDIQAQLRNEVLSITKGKIPTADNVYDMSLLKAFFRETLRLYPIATVMARMADKDLIINGYNVPKNTICLVDLYTMGRSKELFQHPEKFDPSRWQRNVNTDHTPSPFASTPFGFGVRSCIGRRLAELELYLMMARIVQQFEVKPHGTEQLNVMQRGLLTPGAEIPIEFVDRK